MDRHELATSSPNMPAATVRPVIRRAARGSPALSSRSIRKTSSAMRLKATPCCVERRTEAALPEETRRPLPTPAHLGMTDCHRILDHEFHSSPGQPNDKPTQN